MSINIPEKYATVFCADPSLFAKHLLETIASNKPQSIKAKTEEGKITACTLTFPGCELTLSLKLESWTSNPAQLQGLTNFLLMHTTGVETNNYCQSRTQYIQASIGCVAEPAFTHDAFDAVVKMHTYLRGLLFVNNAFIDHTMKVLADPNPTPATEDSQPPQTQATKLQGQQTNSVQISDTTAIKIRSEITLAKQGISFNAHLPPLPPLRSLRYRSLDEILARTAALFVVAVYAETRGKYDSKTLGLTIAPNPTFSPTEEAFLKRSPMNDVERTQFVWRYEALWVLLWALGFTKELKAPTDICSPKEIVDIMNSNTATFLQRAQLRPFEEILQAADLTYRYHWVTKNARIKKQPIPANLEHGVIMERHHALNWLISLGNTAWDDVRTDT